MNETEHTQQTPALAQSGSTDKRVAVLAMVISLLVALLALALWFDVRKMRAQTQAIDAQVQANVESLEKTEREQRTALSAEARERDQQLAERQASLEQGMQAIREQLGREHHEWVIAESDYLLRYASRRLLLERDVRGALIALRSVDELLATGANPLYLPVREQLRAEIQLLEALTLVDVDGIALELSALSKQVDALPLATARREIANAQAEAPAAEEEGSVIGRLFGAMWREVKSLVTVRRLDQKSLPLLAPEQHYFVAQNLRLRLETARLALLRGDAALYQESLKTAAGWLETYYDNDDAAVKQGRDAVTRLMRINIAQPLPELGDTLHTLDRIREKQAGRRPAAANRGRQP